MTFKANTVYIILLTVVVKKCCKRPHMLSHYQDAIHLQKEWQRHTNARALLNMMVHYFRFDSEEDVQKTQDH